MFEIKNKKIILNKKQGFTIIESLVAIFILLLSITGPMVFSQSGLRAAFVSRDQITAFYLAQDVIEYVKNTRDNNSISIINGDAGAFWLNGLDDCFVEDLSDSGCSIDTLEAAQNGTINGVEECSSSVDGCLGNNPDGSGDNPLVKKEDSLGNFYFLGLVSGESNEDNSIFSREIKILPVSPDSADISTAQEVEVVVTIRWNTHETIGSREITVKENIFNWASGI